MNWGKVLEIGLKVIVAVAPVILSHLTDSKSKSDDKK